MLKLTLRVEHMDKVPHILLVSCTLSPHFGSLSPTQSTLCFSDDILFTQVKLFFVGQVSPIHICTGIKAQYHYNSMTVDKT